MSDWIKLIEDPNGPVQFSLGTQVGGVVEENAPYPRLVVTNKQKLYVRRLVWHVLDVDARSDDSNQRESLTIGRLVAEIEGGGEIELQRSVVPSDLFEEQQEDSSTCAACGEAIPVDPVVFDGKSYHKRCTV